jgi:hypothetical protein
MDTPQETQFTFKLSSATEQIKEKQTFILPFVILWFLALPSLAVLAYSKAYTSLQVSDFITFGPFLRVAVAAVVAAIAIFGVMYVIRGKGILSKMAVVVMTLVAISLFAFYNLA